MFAIALAAPVARAQTPQPAASAATSLDAILKDVARYDGGIDSGALWKLRDYVNAHKDDAAGRAECEAKLLAFLKSPATPVAKMAAGRSLRLIAGDTAVPALQALLADDRSADIALYALQSIRAPRQNNALVQALSTSAGATKIAVIAALGERKSAAAVPALAPLLQQPAFAAASATALGRIGGDYAAAALTCRRSPARLVPSSPQWRLRSSPPRRARGTGNTAGASRLYEAVAADSFPPRPASQGRRDWDALVRRSLGRRRFCCAGWPGPTPTCARRRFRRSPGVFTADTIAQVSALLPNLPDAAQIQVLAVLADYPADRVGASVLARLGSESVPVRMAAMKALPAVGGPPAVRPLAERAATASGAEQTAARAALGMLKGRAVDEEILSQLRGKPADDVAAELILAVGERRNFSAKPLVTSSLTSLSPAIRTQAYRALRAIGTPSDMPVVLDALLVTQSEAERTDAEKTVVALSQKLASADGRSAVVRTRLAAEKGTESRVRLIGLLGLMGDTAALPVLRSALKDPEADVVDAAVRAMAAWPTSAAREDLLALARDLRNETHRLLAIRGLIRTIGLDTYRDARAVVADLRLAAGFAWRSDEQKLVLGILGRFPCVEALDLARGPSCRIPR